MTATTPLTVNVLTYTDPQLRFWVDDSRFRLFVGGIGSGKTMGGVIECMRMPPGTTGMVVAPTYPMLRDATLTTFLKLVRETNTLRSFHRGDMVAKLRNGTTVLFRSADDPDRLRGPNLDWFYLDEAAQMTRPVWLVMIGRLRGFPGRGWATTTPAGYNWLYEFFVQGSTSDYSVTHSRTQDNIFLPDAYIRSLETSYDDFWRQQELEGKFLDIGGSAYFNTRWLREWLYRLQEDEAFKPLRHGRDGARGFGGSWSIWEEPEARVEYVLAADVAMGMTKETGNYDYSVFDLFRRDTWCQVASYWGRPDVVLFAQDVAAFSAHFNNAICIVERNEYGHGVLSELRHQGANIYRHIPKDVPITETDDVTADGFPTNQRTKAMVDGMLRSAINANARGEDELILLNPRAVNELITYHNLPGGKRGAVGSCKDDHVRSCGLGYWFLRENAPKFTMPREQLIKPATPLGTRRR